VTFEASSTRQKARQTKLLLSSIVPVRIIWIIMAGSNKYNNYRRMWNSYTEMC